jgi:hypothetical protein
MPDNAAELPYDVLDEDETTFKVKKHADNSVFQVAKKGLDPAAIQRLQSLKVKEPERAPAALEDDMAKLNEDVKAFSQNQAAAQPVAPVPAPAPLPAAPVQSSALPSQAVQEAPALPLTPAMIKANETLAKEIGEVGIEKAKTKEFQATLKAQTLEQLQQAQVAETIGTFEANYKKFESEIEAIQKVVRNGVNPNRFWQSKSDGDKTQAIISVLLSGFGSSLTGQGGNAALDILNRNIDRDIDLQKTNIQNANSLFSQNVARFQNENSAILYRQAQLKAVTAAAIEKAAAQSGNQQAQIRGAEATVKLNQEAQQLLQQVAAQQAEAKSLGIAGIEPGFEEGTEPYSLLKEPEYAKVRIGVEGANGKKRFVRANTPEDAKIVKDFQQEFTPVMDMLDQIKTLAKSSRWATFPLKDKRAKIQSIVAKLPFDLQKMEGLTRLSHEDIDLLQKQFGNPASLLDFNWEAKNDQLAKNLKNKLQSVYETRLFNYKRPRNQLTSFTEEEP